MVDTELTFPDRMKIEEPDFLKGDMLRWIHGTGIFTHILTRTLRQKCR